MSSEGTYVVNGGGRPRRLVTSEHAARLIGVSAVWMRTQCDAGRLEGAVLDGRDWLIPVRSVQAFGDSLRGTGVRLKPSRRTITPRQRAEILEQAGYRCARCRREGQVDEEGDGVFLLIHHKHRACEGGTESRENLEVLCVVCHSDEHDAEAVLRRDGRELLTAVSQRLSLTRRETLQYILEEMARQLELEV